MRKRCMALLMAMCMVIGMTACGSAKPEETTAVTTAATTAAPTTAAPTTEAPTTEAPTTEAPTTEAPTTEAPAAETVNDDAEYDDWELLMECSRFGFAAFVPTADDWLVYTGADAKMVDEDTQIVAMDMTDTYVVVTRCEDYEGFTAESMQDAIADMYESDEGTIVERIEFASDRPDALVIAYSDGGDSVEVLVYLVDADGTAYTEIWVFGPDPDLVFDIVGCITPVPISEASDVFGAYEYHAEDFEESETEGDASANVYRNEAFNLMAEFPEDWTIASEEEIAELSGQTDSTLDSVGIEMASYMDLYAERMDPYCNVNIQVESISAVYGTILTEEDIVNDSISQMGLVEEVLGLTDTAYEVVNVSLGGETKVALAMNGILQQAVRLYELIIPIISGDKVITITFSALDEASIADGLALFRFIK